MWPLANDKSWELPLTIIVESFNAFLNMYKYVYVGGGGGCQNIVVTINWPWGQYCPIV